jgi:hypothetical protein
MPRTTRITCALAVAAAIALSGCQSTASPTPTPTPTPPPISDPLEILTKSAASLASVKTIHLQLDLSGTVKLNLTGAGSGSSLDLKGTTGSIDADVAGKSLHATVTAPGFLNSGVDAIVNADAVYYKITGGLAQGTTYTKIAIPANVGGAAASASPDASAAMAGLQAALASLKPQLDKLPKPAKGADQPCGDTTCYTVTYDIAASDLAALSSAAPSGTIPPGELNVEILSRATDLRPARITLHIVSGDQADLTLAIAATYDQPVTIMVPPADQVVEGSGGLPFPIPSLAP